MGEYEPDDSRDVTLSDHQAPGEPPRTGPREDEARRKAQQEQTNRTDGREPNAELARKDEDDAWRVREARQQDEG